MLCRRGRLRLLEFRILGGLEALDGERPLALGSPKQRLLLGALILHAGRPLSVDDLIETIWPEQPPASAGHAVEVYVSRLRKVLHGDGTTRLESTSRGYVADLGGAVLDATRFEELTELARAASASGHATRAAGLFREALSLWRGEPLGGLDGGPLVRAAVDRLEELRLAALEDRIDADLACGSHRGVISELEALVDAEPLRERFRAQLMVALYRDGRQADALDAYRAARATLRDELGLDPGRSLQELERAILNQDPALDFATAVEARPARVPAPLTPLVGRETEVDQLEKLLQSEGARLITITGAGGIGKTRLAIATARRLADAFGGGVAFVELAPVRREDLVLPAIGSAFGVQERLGVSVLETIAERVAGRPTLLVLDNFEHLLGCAPAVAELLTRADQLTVLATSRSRLGLYGEHEYAVGPLSVPPAGEHGVDAVASFAAVELFVACARRRSPAFRLEPRTAAAVGEICIRLDGMPLAIELAAARSHELDAEALLAQLDERLPVLVGGPRDAPERHRSMRATIDWSYELLDPDERRLFASLSIFTGGFTAAASADVCAAGVAVCDSLVEKHLVSRDDGRFSMLETLREYGLERLRESGSYDALRRRHAEWFLALSEQADEALRGPAQVQWLARLDTEEANIWGAFGWGMECGRPDVSLRIGAALWRYWEARGGITQARRRLDEALESGAGGDARPRALFASGRMALRQGDLTHARRVFAESAALFQAAGDRGGVALAEAGLGWIAHVLGPAEKAVALCRDAVSIARDSGEAWILADALNNLGVALRASGELDASRDALDESLALRTEIGDLEGVTACLNGLALIAIAQDAFDDADALFRRAFSISRLRGDLFYAAAESIVLAYLAFGRGDLERATELSIRALDACSEHGYQQFAAYALETLAGVEAARGRLRQAARIVGAATAISESIGRAVGGGSEGVAYDWEARAVKRVLEEAHRRLGVSGWDASVDEGRRLGVAEVAAAAAEWTTRGRRGALSAR